MQIKTVLSEGTNNIYTIFNLFYKEFLNTYLVCICNMNESLNNTFSIYKRLVAMTTTFRHHYRESPLRLRTSVEL
jgi:hypothetical protein